VGKQMAPMTPGLVSAVLGSGLMVSATVMIAVLHAIMFGEAREVLGPDRDASAALYLWIGTAEAASTAWAAVVLYRLPWQRLTPGRGVVLALGAASTLLALGLWLSFWSGR
jgi:hypothetical protein